MFSDRPLSRWHYINSAQVTPSSAQTGKAVFSSGLAKPWSLHTWIVLRAWSCSLSFCFTQRFYLSVWILHQIPRSLHFLSRHLASSILKQGSFLAEKYCVFEINLRIVWMSVWRTQINRDYCRLGAAFGEVVQQPVRLRCFIFFRTLYSVWQTFRDMNN